MELSWGLGGNLGREIGTFFTRTGGLTGAVSFDRPQIIPGLFYMGWVCIVLSVITIGLLSRLKGEATLAAIMLVSLAGMWMNTGAIPLAASGPAQRHQWFALALTGAVAGLALGAYLRRLHLGRATPVVMGGALALMVAMPFVAPFVKLQSVVPLMATLRFPRFYVVAPLGLALGAAFPIRYVSRWAALNRPDWKFLQPAVLAGVVLLAFFVDILPYRSYYTVPGPESDAAYQRMSDALAAAGDESRLTTGRLDPRSVAGLVKSGRELSVGWPHPVGGRECGGSPARPMSRRSGCGRRHGVSPAPATWPSKRRRTKAPPTSGSTRSCSNATPAPSRWCGPTTRPSSWATAACRPCWPPPSPPGAWVS